jgi:hypothetical protein
MDTKRWYLSKTVVSGLITFLVGAMGLMGYAVDPNDQKTVADAVLAVTTSLTGLTAIYGRVKATKTLV